MYSLTCLYSSRRGGRREEEFKRKEKVEKKAIQVTEMTRVGGRKDTKAVLSEPPHPLKRKYALINLSGIKDGPCRRFKRYKRRSVQKSD